MRKFLGLTALLLVFSLTMTAQEKKKEIRKRVQMSSEQMATLQSKKMALALELDKNQQKELAELFKKQGDQRKEMFKSLKAAKEKQEKPTADQRFKLMNDRLDKQIVHKESIRKILSEEQFGKWSKMNKGKQVKMREMAEKRRKGRSQQRSSRTMRSEHQKRNRR